MRYHVGVDLGSTTTKAVILDDQGQIVGCGITNSRSNYDVASSVAMREALITTRMSLVEQALSDRGAAAAEIPALLAGLERQFRKHQYLAQLEALGTELLRVAGVLHTPEPETEAMQRIVAAMRAEADELYAAGARRKSDFFRDLAGGRYHALAEAETRAHQLGFETLVALYDKAILEVENATGSGSFTDFAAASAAEVEGAPQALAAAVADAAAVELQQISSVGTGYGRARLPFPKAQIRSEILCHGLGAHAMFADTRTVLDIGGQDTKAIQVDPRGIVTSFQMNDRCAAGCGRYLGYIADEMNLALHELGPLAQKATRGVRINSTCTVFAGAELRERLALGEKREDILAGLHRAIVLRAMSLLARSGGVADEFTFTGGVAKNPAAVAALTSLIRDNYGEGVTINISPDSIYTGALGAALFAWRAGNGDDPQAAPDDDADNRSSVQVPGEK